MDGSAKDFCQLIEDGDFEEQDETYEELVIDKMYTFGPKEEGGAHISIEPYDGFKVRLSHGISGAHRHHGTHF